MSNRTDNFTRADSSVTMNPPSDGGANWAAPTGGTWGIATNQGRAVSSTSQSVIALEASLSNVDVQCTFATVGSDGGLCARLADDANYLVLKVSGTALTLFKKVANSFTQIGDAGAITISNNDVIKLRCDSANLLNAFQNGVSKFSVTDAAGSTNTQHGLRDNADTNGRFTVFSITDLGAAGDTSTPILNFMF